MTETSYDRIPYKSYSFPQSHPDRLATLATLLGLNPPAVETCRVLELGCASGGNLIPMADQYPQATFLGIDASKREIEDGQALLAKTGLKNIELRTQDILKFPADAGTFDYILCHGVYSWVPDDVQQAILNVIRQHLAPNGVAYVSYNTYPGWNLRGTIRDIMRYRASFFTTPDAQLSQARSLLEFLSNSVKGEQSPYALLLRQELEAISRSDDSYLHHEHLEHINEPIYFHNFAERLKTAGLQFLAESDFGAMSLEGFPEPVRAMLKSVASDIIEQEQYIDFLRNRAFRQSLIVHHDATISRDIDVKRLQSLYVATNASEQQPAADSKQVAKNETTFRRGGGALTTTNPLVKAAMQHLANAWPRAIPFPELASAARSIATGQPAAVDADVMSPMSAQLADAMLRSFATRVIDLRTSQPSCAATVPEKPDTFTFTRVQAAIGSSVTNSLHERVQLDDFLRQTLLLLDGTRTADDIAHALAEKIVAGELIVFNKTQRVTDQESARTMAGQQIAAAVGELVRRGLVRG